MADINHVITLGIGTPSGVPEFLTFGLQIGAPPVVERPTDVDGLRAMSVNIRMAVSVTSEHLATSKTNNIKARSVS